MWKARFKAKNLRRCLSNAVFLGTVGLWIISFALFIRSRYRSDAALVALPGYLMVEISSDDGLFDLGLSKPFIGNHVSFSLSSSSTYSPTMGVYEGAELRGQNFRDDIQFTIQHDPNDPNFPARIYSWRRFSCGYGFGPEGYRKNEQNVDFDSPFRSMFGGGGLREVREYDTIIREGSYFVSVPVWALPVGLAILPCFWLMSAGRQRWRSHRRSKMGLCTTCGYDLRASPAKCPECGMKINPASSGAREWRMAFYSDCAVLCAIALLLNRLNPIQDCKPSTDDRRPSQVGMVIPWNPEAEHPDLLKLVLGDNGPYTIRLEVGNPGTMTLLRESKAIYSWQVRPQTAFKIDHDVLYREGGIFIGHLTDFSQPLHIPKKTILAIDLHNGHQLWESALIDAPRLQQGATLCMEVRSDRLFIWGDDPNGRYAEVKDIHTGKTVGYDIYDQQAIHGK